MLAKIRRMHFRGGLPLRDEPALGLVWTADGTLSVRGLFVRFSRNADPFPVIATQTAGWMDGDPHRAV